jgi:hypothetical protein
METINLGIGFPEILTRKQLLKPASTANLASTKLKYDEIVRKTLKLN